MKNIFSWIRQHKWIIVLLVLVLTIGGCVIWARKAVSGLMKETKLETRDLVTYNSFVGTVEADSDYNVIPKVSSSVQSVLVKKGDEVTQGQILAVLDSSAVEYSIKLQEATIGQSGTSSYYSIKDAETSYENYKKTVEGGLNSSLISASHAKDTAWNVWDKAKKAYTDGVASINSGIASAESAINTAKSARDVAKAAYDAIPDKETTIADYQTKETEKTTAETELSAVKTAEEIAKLEYELDPTNPVKEAAYETAKENTKKAQIKYDTAVLDLETIKPKYEAVMVAKTAYETAESAYNTAVATLNNLKNTKDSSIESLRKAVSDAEHELEMANITYDSTVLSVQQQLQTLQDSVERIKATSSNASSQLELQHTKDSLKDYTITAPVSGTITSLNIKEGDMAAAGTPAAVISNVDTMKIAIKVDEYSILNVEVGKPVLVYIDSIDSTYDGVISTIANTVTSVNGVSYYEATVNFQSDAKVRSGMSVEVRLVSTNEKGAQVLPAEAISYRDDNSAYVLVKTKNGTEERDIMIGVSDGDYVQVTSGLTEEDTVVYVPVSELTNGRMAVEVNE